MIVQDGLRRMLAEQEDVFYYLTLMNENYPHPAMPEGAEEGILRGIYPLRDGGKDAKRAAAGLGHDPARGASPRPTCCATTSASRPTSAASRASPSCAATAWTAERWNRLHPGEEPRVPYVASRARRPPGRWPRPTTCARSPTRSARGVPGRYRVLGTDGFGRSDYRKALRAFFEVDRHHVALAALPRSRRPARSTRARGRRRSSGTRSTRSVPRHGRSVTVSVEQVLVPDIGDFADVPVIEILVAVGRHGGRGGPAGHARVRQGDDGRARRRPPARWPRSKVTVGDKVSEGTPLRQARGRRRGAGRRGRAGADRGAHVAAQREEAVAEARPRRPSAGRREAAGRGRLAPGRRRQRAAVRQPVGAPAGPRAGRRPRSAVRGSGRKGRITKEDVRGFRTRRRRRRPPAGAAASTSRRGRRSTSSLRRGRARAADAHPEDLRPEPGPQLGDDPARHPPRRGGHHRPGGVPQAHQRRAVRRQGDDGGAAGEGLRGLAEGVPASSTRRSTATSWSSSATTTSASPPTRRTGCSCR